MTAKVRRIVFQGLVLVVAAAGLAAPAHAQPRPQSVQQRPVAVTQVWGQDGWLYVMQGGRWVRTAYSRRYPDPRNYPAVYDVFQNGRFVQRVGAAAPSTANDAIRVQQLVNQLNQLTAAERARAAQSAGRLNAGATDTIGGFSLNTPNVNMLTVDSVRTDYLRQHGSPLVQRQIALSDAINGQSYDNTIKTALGYVYVIRR